MTEDQKKLQYQLDALGKLYYAASLLVETLPACEQQTELSIRASFVGDGVERWLRILKDTK